MTRNNVILANQIARHYHWLINSPSLFEKGLVAANSYQTFFYELQPQVLAFEDLQNHLTRCSTDHTKINYHLPLGKYTELLFEQHFKTSKKFELLQHNTQVQIDKITLGEIDYLLEIDQQVHHIELAIKFYLCADDPLDASRWLGPNAKDSLANKLAKNEHAFGLTKSTAYRHLWKKQPETWQWLIKGCWFFHPTQPHTFYTSANIQSEKGVWIKNNELLHLDEDAQYYIPIKTDWILPPENPPEFMNCSQLKQVLNTHFEKSNRAIMIWNITSLQRLCVVHSEWPNL